MSVLLTTFLEALTRVQITLIFLLYLLHYLELGLHAVSCFFLTNTHARTERVKLHTHTHKHIYIHHRGFDP